MSYQIPRKLGRRWVEQGKLLPLLDGLDEVVLSERSDCIDAINTYRRDYLVPLVVCSRTTDYLAQMRRLMLISAVVAQPLSLEQIGAYLDDAGPALAAVKTVLQTNQVLQELATSPLMLNILLLTYRDADASTLPSRGSQVEQQRQSFTHCVQRMVFYLDVRFIGPPGICWGLQIRATTLFNLRSILPCELGRRLLLL